MLYNTEMMLTKFCFLKVFLLFILTFSQFNFILFARNNSNYPEKIKEKIERVENGLTSYYLLTDRDKTYNLVARMKEFSIPAVSVAVIDNYKLQWAKAYGLADVESKQLATTETLFQAASISKSINALGVLKLVEDRKINLTTDINQYLLNWKFPYDEKSKGQKINVANLLSHTAGTTVSGFGGYATDKKVPTTVQVLSGEKPTNSGKVVSQFEPNLRFQYSGGGTVISQLIVQDVTKMPYEKYMKKKVLRRLGMKNSSFAQPPKHKNKLASAYFSTNEAVKGKYHLYPEMAPAGLWTNPTELSKFIIETQLSLKGKSNKILSKDLTEKMLTPYIKNSNSALGVFVDEVEGTKYFQHQGANQGFRCAYFGSFEDGKGVVVMSNSSNFKIITEIINSVAGAYKWKGKYAEEIKKIAEIPKEIIKKYAGEYKVNENWNLKLEFKNGNLSHKNPWGQDIYFYPESKTKFFLKDFVWELEFVVDESGKVKKLLMNQNGKTFEAVKTK